MMSKNLFIFLFLFILSETKAQQGHIEERFTSIADQNKKDLTTVNALIELAIRQVNADSAIMYATKGLSIAREISNKKGEADCYFIIAKSKSIYSEAIQNAIGALKIYEEVKDSTGIASTYLILQGNYRAARDYKKALVYAIAGEEIAEAGNINGVLQFPGHRLVPLFWAEIGKVYLLKKQPDSALFYTQKAIDQKELFNGSEWNFPRYLLGSIHNTKGNFELALVELRIALSLARQNGIGQDTLQVFSGMSNVFKNTGELDSSIFYAQIVEQSTNPEKEIEYWLSARQNLAFCYKLSGDKDSALRYTELSNALKDSIFNIERQKEIENITFGEKLKQQEVITEQEKYKREIQLYILIAGLFVFVLIASLLWRNNLHKQKAKIRIEQAYDNLKATQEQLIQSEKMASLGELTAGIAHEIQNPLNFVNNFSEVSNELIDEMNQELNKGDIKEAKLIAEDIKQNLEKINHHGKRADAIVKGMLQHSRSSSGTKEPTDINALCDEYLRLSHHGLRAKDKSFNATMKTDFDESIGNINIIPQDIGRVILNLINNAFYAVTERKKQNTPGYEPIVSVNTKKQDGKIEIRVKDNGNGIPAKVLDKIFQPFFTTKPTGQGTGLGLSLSYDIIKAHGGELKVETKEGAGTVFVIHLPT